MITIYGCHADALALLRIVWVSQVSSVRDSVELAMSYRYSSFIAAIPFPVAELFPSYAAKKSETATPCGTVQLR